MELLAESTSSDRDVSEEQVADALNDGSLRTRKSLANDNKPDVTARHDYFLRLQEIKKKIEDLDPQVEKDKIAELREEAAGIAEQLETAKNARRSGSNRERARNAAASQYRMALKALANAGLKKLVAHLKSRIARGNSFEYMPPSDASISWEVDPTVPRDA